jgi:hypothetical protein
MVYSKWIFIGFLLSFIRLVFAVSQRQFPQKENSKGRKNAVCSNNSSHNGSESLFFRFTCLFKLNHTDDFFKNDIHTLNKFLLILFSLVFLSSLKLFHQGRRILLAILPRI